ncbi:MAG: discoidin domain-containing protein, partial [Prevotella sp.]|nr:discoidin domain-containing protein [Prevotella sp.]
MKASKIFLWAFLITVCSTVAQAQTLKLGPENNTANIIASPQVITLDYNDFATIAVSSNYPYNNIHSDADWLTWKLQKNGNIAIFAQPNYNLNSRSAYLNIEIDPAYKDKVSNLMSSMVFVLQKGKDSSDKQLTIKSGTASQAESGYAITRSFDGDNSTFYHSPWSSATTRFPVTLTYTLNEPSHVDYAIYTPRQDGNNNGNFQEVVVSYQVEGSNEWITLRTMNLSGSGSSSYISFGDNGVDNVKAVQFTVNSGANGFACVAEMAFYQKDTFFNDIVSEIFADNLCTQLKDGVTKEQIDQIAVDGIRNLATAIYEGTYSTKYRVGEFEAYRPVNDLINELRNSYTYNNHENPTGISFKNGENVMVIAEGIGDYPVTLQVRNFGPTDFTTDYYPLTNGINVISC